MLLLLQACETDKDTSATVGQAARQAFEYWGTPYILLALMLAGFFLTIRRICKNSFV